MQDVPTAVTEQNGAAIPLADVHIAIDAKTQ
jgi:hypothetical protein